MAWYTNSNNQCVTTAKVNMCFKIYCVYIISLYFLNCYALNCRSDGGPKEEELKAVYQNCLKKQEGRNSSDSRRFVNDHDWNEPRGYNDRNQWDRDGRSNRNRSNDKNDRGTERDRSVSRDNRMGGRDDRMGDRDHRMDNRDRMGSNDRGSGRDRMEGRDDRMSGRGEGMGGMNRDEMGYRDDDMGKYHFNGRDDFSSDEYGGPSRRFRRDRHKEMNSGHRSQYNPNAQKPAEYEDSYRSDERNSSRNSSKDEENKACALHCFLEHMEMIGDNGMPDKYLVTHTLTKDVKNEDLRDFLQESIEECFQILDNENPEDKCEFSKNLMTCLSEKGRANCDNWKDDLKF